MATASKIKRYKKWLIYTAAVLLGTFLILLIFVDRFVEPILRKRLHTLIVQGSDSLYTYQLGKLNANFFGGNVRIVNLQIEIDSSRFVYLKQRNRLPALTMQLDLKEGNIKGLSLLSLLFGKKIILEEISSTKANINLSRHLQTKKEAVETDVPLWKSIRPDIKSIAVNRIKLDGVKLLYKNADTSESVKLQFDECNALFEDLLVDSAAANDTSRIGFAKVINLRFHDLKFRTPDSSYKMKAQWITYSSKDRLFEMDSFKLQPTMEGKEFYKNDSIQKTAYVVELQKVRIVNTKLERFINENIISADSIVFNNPGLNIYLDRSMQPVFESKIGKYPHQKLLKLQEIIDIKAIALQNANFQYTEKNPKTEKEGTISFNGLQIFMQNVTNDPKLVLQNPICNASASGMLFGSSPIKVDFKFFLDSANGAYNAAGYIKNVSAAQLRPLAGSLANVQINSFDIQSIDFNINGRDFDANGFVKMRYNNLDLIMKKKDDETGVTSTAKFLTKILNKFVIWPGNPGPDGIERTSGQAKALRLSTQSFFGLLWKTIFDGMQDIMMKSGRY